MAPPTSKSKGKLTLSAASRPSHKAASTRPAPSSKKGKEPQSTQPSHDDDEDDDDDDDESVYDQEGDEQMSEPDTDQEIATAKAAGKSKKTAKRKRRAVSPTSFGATLQGLLGATGPGEDEGSSSAQGGAASSSAASDEEELSSAPVSKRTKTTTTTTTQAQAQQSAILSLAPHIRRAAQSSRLNEKAGRLAVAARKEREEKARVKDVIGGWGRPGQLPPSSNLVMASEEAGAKGAEDEKAEREWQEGGGAQGYERKLRKVAQRGVVKLFNAIRAAQNTTEQDLEDDDMKEEEEVKRGKGKGDKVTPASVKGRNVLGGKEKAVKDLSKANFLQLIKAGGGGGGAGVGGASARG